MNNSEIAQSQLDAYNAQDIDAYCACFTEDCVIADLNAAASSTGRAAIRDHYAKTFASFPQKRAILLHRIVLGNVVLDHEDVVRAHGGERFQVAPFRPCATALSPASILRSEPR